MVWVRWLKPGAVTIGDRSRQRFPGDEDELTNESEARRLEAVKYLTIFVPDHAEREVVSVRGFHPNLDLPASQDG